MNLLLTKLLFVLQSVNREVNEAILVNIIFYYYYSKSTRGHMPHPNHLFASDPYFLKRFRKDALQWSVLVSILFPLIAIKNELEAANKTFDFY